MLEKFQAALEVATPRPCPECRLRERSLTRAASDGQASPGPLAAALDAAATPPKQAQAQDEPAANPVSVERSSHVETEPQDASVCFNMLAAEEGGLAFNMTADEEDAANASLLEASLLADESLTSQAGRVTSTLSSKTHHRTVLGTGWYSRLSWCLQT